MKLIFIFLLTFLFIQDIQASQRRKVLIIGIAGARSDCFQQANTPVIDGIIANGFYTYESWHRGITLSGPSWSTMMCGVEYNRHNVTDDYYTGSNYNTYPYFPTLAKRCLPNLYCSQITQWPPMADNVYNDGWNKKLKVQYGLAAQSALVAKNELNNANLDVLFVCFDDCDIVGHSTGFSPTNPDYISAIEKVDSNVGLIMTALKNRINYANEDWIVIITTDYGGIGTSHGGNSDQERNIWWIGAGNSIGSRQLAGVKDPGSLSIGNFNLVESKKSPAQFDVAVTALDHLFRESICSVDTAWHLDGQSWLDSMQTGIKIPKAEKFEIKTYPNPTTGIVTVWFENQKREAISYNVFNATGQLVSENEHALPITQNKLNIDLSKFQKGIYYVELMIGSQKVTKQIVFE